MVTTTRTVAPLGTSLKSLVNGFVLTKQTEGKSPRTVEFYSENLKRFLWYGSRQEWPDDIRLITDIGRIDSMRNSTNTVRRDLPDEALETERKSESHGRQPVLVS